MGSENALRWAYKKTGGGAQFSHNNSERDESGLAIVEAIRPRLATRKEKERGRVGIKKDGREVSHRPRREGRKKDR